MTVLLVISSCCAEIQPCKSMQIGTNCKIWPSIQMLIPRPSHHALVLAICIASAGVRRIEAKLNATLVH